MNTQVKPSFAEAFKVWLTIGCINFGGPAAQIALMHRILVDEKKWVEDSRFLHALNFCMLLPGPEAQKLATYLGWLLHGMRGGLAAGILFVLPGAFVMLGACPPDRDPETAPTNHSAVAVFDDAALADGTALYAELAVRRLSLG